MGLEGGEGWRGREATRVLSSSSSSLLVLVVFPPLHVPAMSSDGATVRRPAAPTQSSSSYLQDTPPPPPSPPVASTSTASYSLHTGPPEDASTSDALPVDPATLLRPASRGVEDLANKSCWICYSEEPAGEWVHACRCTLVAHCDVRPTHSHSPQTAD